MRLKGLIKRLGMPFKSDPGPVAAYKERKHSHVLCGGGGRDFCQRKCANILSVISGGLASLKSLFGFSLSLHHCIEVPEKGDPDNSTAIPRQIKRPDGECTGWR